MTTTLTETQNQVMDSLWIDVNLKALMSNLAQIRYLIGKDVKITSVVKANGYGHGISEISECLAPFVDYLGVANAKEAQRIREFVKEAPILIFGGIQPEEVAVCLEQNFSVVLSSLDHAKKLQEYAEIYSKPLKVHVKVDTGMGRMGFVLEEALNAIKILVDNPSFDVEGLMTHFPVAEEVNHPKTNEQIKEFQLLIKELKNQGIDIPLQHAANSSGLINFPDSHFNMVRPGLSLYGVSSNVNSNKVVSLEPVLNLKTRVHLIKHLKKGQSVSYGCHFVLPKDGYVAVLPVGYGHGYPYALSQKGRVLIQGKSFPVCGNVCMDYTLLYLGSDDSIKEGDEVVLIGQQGEEVITCNELAEKANTIPYEILTRLSSAIPRYYIS